MQKKQYKVLISDVDGTLIPNKREGMPSKSVITAIQIAQKTHHIGLATSRPYGMLQDIIASLNLSGLIVLNGGSQIMDLSSKKIVHEQAINKKDFISIYEILEKHHLTYFIEDERKTLNMAEKHVATKILKIFALAQNPKNISDAMRTLSQLPDVAVHTVPDWDESKESLVISHRLATKAHGIQMFAKLLSLSQDDMIGVGDGQNDIPLLSACGFKVAMGNAVLELKAIADYIAPSVEKDGLAHVINKFILAL